MLKFLIRDRTSWRNDHFLTFLSRAINKREDVFFFFVLGLPRLNLIAQYPTNKSVHAGVISFEFAGLT